ncbi:MAG TPA: YqgE/AlgH family protein [Brevundimonas sp.]|uniref:YqgE/AlgH family protein n=1 Tax=Brevundimonas sp. TaxID=1871086 RepID=UPI002631E514|nr:YqgE/AlgH family protein [Brevundimonas sp.]HRO34135.1 YqgE/AlgH family protein [Brevundimonas sp.]
MSQFQSESQFQSLAGRLLVAMPGIGDPRFEHAVILICAHEADHAMGLRLDRPADGVTLKTVLSRLDLTAPDAAAGRGVLVGGPVERERGFVLHTDDWISDDTSLPIVAGLAMTGTREALSAMTDPETGPDRSILLLGYAGWGEGQLEDELAENVWLVAEAAPDLIFDTAHDTKWSRALAGIGVDAAQLSATGGRA